MIIGILRFVVFCEILHYSLLHSLKRTHNIIVTCVSEEMIQHYCTKLNESQTDHDICDSRENTLMITILIGYCI